MYVLGAHRSQRTGARDFPTDGKGLASGRCSAREQGTVRPVEISHYGTIKLSPALSVATL